MQAVVHTPIHVNHLRSSLLALSLALVLLPAARAGAYQSFSASRYAYQGIELESGMTEFDPTVLTVVIGDALEIDAIAAPDIDPLFQFNPEIDVFFSLTTDAAAMEFLRPAEEGSAAIAVLDEDDEAEQRKFHQHRAAVDRGTDDQGRNHQAGVDTVAGGFKGQNQALQVDVLEFDASRR